MEYKKGAMAAMKTLNMSSALQQLVFGGMFYMAPDYFFGPNGRLVNISLVTAECNTSMESNCLDPIAIHYTRCNGAAMLGGALGYFLYSKGTPVGEWEFARAALRTNLALIPLVVSLVMEDENGCYSKSNAKFYTILGALTILLYCFVLMKVPEPPIEAIKPPMRLRLMHVFVCLATGYFGITKYFFGASSFFFPKTPLEGNKFDPIMMNSARFMGAWFLPTAFTIFDVHGAAQLVLFNKLACLSCILWLPVFYKNLYDTSGYFNQSGHIGLMIFLLFETFVVFRTSGAFGPEATSLQTHHKTKFAKSA